MKKVSTLICLMLLFSGVLMAQQKPLDIRIKYSGSQTEITADITVTVNDGKADFTYYLMTNDPLKGKILFESRPEKKNTYTFKNVKPGAYFLKITDGEGKIFGKTVRIKTEN